MGKLFDVSNALQELAQMTAAEKNYMLSTVDWLESDSATGLNDIAALLGSRKAIHFMSKGEWDQHQLLAVLLEYTGAADVTIATYAMSETAVRALSALKDAGKIQCLNCLIDNRVDTRSAGSLQLLMSIARICVLAPCHAKVTIVAAAGKCALVVGSANYTENKRFEGGIIFTDPESVLFHLKWINAAIKEYATEGAG